MRLAPPLLLAVLLATAACGDNSSGSPRVDAQEVEQLLVQRQKERNPSLRVGEAACPAEIQARQGETFQCTVEVEGQPVPVAVTLAEVLGNERVRYDFRPLQAVVDVQGTLNFLRSRLDDKWRTAAIDCGPTRARVLNVGAVIDCTITRPPDTRRVQAVVEDLDGTVRLQEL